MSCWNCGTANEPGARFCINCGSPQAVACAACGHANPSNARFCSNCGSPMGADAAAPAATTAPPPAVGPIAERRLVSVLFVDLVGFTTLSEDRDPEETRELLSRYFELARRTVEGHGGTIEKFIGDAVMAVWGAPTAHEDDAERAVRAALELVGAVAQLNEAGTELRARAGVVTGEAAVTIGAQGQGMVAGDLVNTASRLQSVAPAGTVLVGEATYRAAANAVTFEPAGEQLLKGKTSPVPAWRAVAVVARRGGSGRASTLEPPFVGREDELQQLKDLFHATARERKPRLVTVIGQAGIGKSRLAWEFEKYLDGVVETVYWHEGRSPAYGEGVSFWALAEMVRRRAGIAEGASPEDARRLLSDMLDEFIPDPADRHWIEPRLAGLLGLAELPVEGREELFSAWRKLFERIGDVAPVVMVFVDLHWADEGLLDFVESLLAWSRSSPIFVVALSRPELVERRPDWGSSARSVTRINLEPLADEEMRQLLRGLLPGVPDAAVDRIVERAEGVPLYAVETVRMLLDTGAVVPEGDGYAVRGDLSRLAVAETLQALIAARLDSNRPEDRALLQDAAILGTTFAVPALAAVSGADEAALAPRLDRLVRRQLLMLDADARSPERGQYRFVQGLVREIAYQSLAREDRRARHLAAARYYESLGVDELAGVLANHYLDAFRASRAGAEADALAAQARIALHAAADRALALHSHRQAIAFLELALTVTTDPAEQALIHERIAQSAELAGPTEIAKGPEHAREARDLYRSLGDREGVVRASTWWGRTLVVSQLETEAAEVLQAAIDEAAALGDVPELGATYAELARVHMLMDRHEQAVAAADRALTIPSTTVWAVVEALTTKGTSLGPMGRWMEGEATLRGAIHIADREGLVPASLRARNNLCGPMIFIDLGEAETLAREGYDMAQRLGHRIFAHQFLWNLLETAWHRGDWDAWTAERDEVIATESPSPFQAAGFNGGLAERLAMRGRVAEAYRAVDEAIRVTEGLTTAQLETAPHLSRAWVKLIEGLWEDAAAEGRLAGVNTNFTVEAWFLGGMAAIAGDLPEVHQEALVAFARSPMFGPGVDAMRRVLESSGALRWGAERDADHGFGAALEQLLKVGDATMAHIAGLLWDGLRGSTPGPAARAGEEAATFFRQRGAAAFVDRFRAAFVPLAEAAPATPGAEALAERPAAR